MAASKFKLPDWINKEDWNAFVKMRIKIKKPMSDRAKVMAVKALAVLRSKGEDPGLALQFAEYKCNQGIFPVPNWYREMLGLEIPKRQDPNHGNF